MAKLGTSTASSGAKNNNAPARKRKGGSTSSTPNRRPHTSPPGMTSSRANQANRVPAPRTDSTAISSPNVRNEVPSQGGSELAQNLDWGPVKVPDGGNLISASGGDDSWIMNNADAIQDRNGIDDINKIQPGTYLVPANPDRDLTDPSMGNPAQLLR